MNRPYVGNPAINIDPEVFGPDDGPKKKGPKLSKRQRAELQRQEALRGRVDLIDKEWLERKGAK